MMRKVFMFVLALSLALVSASAFAQDIQTSGTVGGTVTDQNGAAVPGATVTVSGALLGTAGRTATTDGNGVFAVENLKPGSYSVKVSGTGFKTASVSDVEVVVGKQAALAIKLEPGEVTAIVNVTAAQVIDKASTATSSNLSDQLFNNIPIQRNVTSLFYLAPGVTDSLGGGGNNPSISGGSALDNLYVADGVNITDSAFGGIGTFSRSYGGLGTGINTAFVKEVQVKTAGFEAQYGQSEGGIVNIITQSGGNEFHGAAYTYFAPNGFEATRQQPDDLRTNKAGKILHQSHYDTGGDFGGPIVKNRLFFFGSINPSWDRTLVRGATGSGLLTLLGDHTRKYRSLNYAGKVDYSVNPNHQITFSIYGDPTKTNVSSFRSLNIDNTTAQSSLDYGSRNLALRWNGSLTPSWTMSASFGWNHNHFGEAGFANFNQIVDRTNAVRGNFTAIGLGFFEPTTGNTYRLDWSTQKIKTLPWHLGTHTVTIGYQYQRAYYAGTRDRSGPKYTVPATNATGQSVASLGGGPAIGQTMNAAWSLRSAGTLLDNNCPLCPVMTVNGTDLQVYLRQDRGEYGQPIFNTRSNYNAIYGQDVIRFNKYVTANVGLRSEQERIIGNQNAVKYSFTDQWAPRLGVTVDPTGRGKTKIYYNYGRFFEYIPLDEAERSLSSELDIIGSRYAPDFTPVGGVRRAVLNSFGTVTPVVDAAHLLTGATGGTGTGISVSTQSTANPILPGTKLGYADEHTLGFEQQLPRNFVLSVRYINRHLGRITEDAAVLAPEDGENGLFGQAYFIGNINAKMDVAVNPIPHVYAFGTASALKPAACRTNAALPWNATTNPLPYDEPEVDDSFGNPVGAVCYSPFGANGGIPGNFGADGVADGFPDPVHRYKAVEIELNKRFSNHWQMLSNWRIAKVVGNFEGHFRNDNGQTDPGISSLFDFTGGSFNLLGDQFKPGVLNTDRRHIVNVYGNYEFSKERGFKRLAGLNLGPAIHFETGVPISQFYAHPAYLNAGEIPVGGRGSLGRTAPYFRFDMHVNYPVHLTEKVRLNFVSDFFNVFNSTKIRLPDQNVQTTVGQVNPDFLKPVAYYLPFNMRVGVRLEW
jgi:hypothetical protein